MSETDGIVWCAFCEDRPAVGRMILMKDESREVIGEVDPDIGAACDLHGRAWTGAPVGGNEETGEIAVLQYLHPNFEQVTEKDIVDFAADTICSVCGDPMGPIELWVAERVLRANPHIVLDKEFRWDSICGDCTENLADDDDDD